MDKDDELEALIAEHRELTDRLQAHGAASRAFDRAERELTNLETRSAMHAQRLERAEKKVATARAALEAAPLPPEEEVSAHNRRMAEAAKARGLDQPPRLA